MRQEKIKSKFTKGKKAIYEAKYKKDQYLKMLSINRPRKLVL